MNGLWKLLLSLSVSGGLLILLILLLRPVWKKRLSQQWQYYIWLLVVLRLLVPYTPATSVVGAAFQAVDRAVVQTQEDLTGQQAAPSQTGQAATPPQDGNPLQRAAAFAWQWSWMIWLLGVLLLFLRKLTTYQSFVRYVRAGQTPVVDTSLLDKLALLGEQTGVMRPVELCINPLISSPLLIGFFRPCIVLPGINLSDAELQYTLMHELTHFRRGDMFYKWLVQLIICLHWFNPLVYVMGREVSRACELSCDEALISKLPDTGRREYGETLLNAMGRAGSYKEPTASVTLSENKELLKERIEAIMRFQRKSKKSISAFVTLLLLFVSTVTGAYATRYSEYALPLAKTLRDIPQHPSEPASPPEAQPGPVRYSFQISSNPGQLSIIESGSFTAYDGETLTLTITSGIKGGTVDFFLVSPDGESSRIEISGENQTRSIALAAGTWAYNCTGFFQSGSISVQGAVEGKTPAKQVELREMVIPIALDTLRDGTEICVVQLPVEGQVTQITYQLEAEGTQGVIYVGVRQVGGNKNYWYNYVDSDYKNRFDIHMSYSIDKISYDNTLEDYAIYLGSQGGTVSNITGTLTIQYAVEKS